MINKTAQELSQAFSKLADSLIHIAVPTPKKAPSKKKAPGKAAPSAPTSTRAALVKSYRQKFDDIENRISTEISGKITSLVETIRKSKQHSTLVYGNTGILQYLKSYKNTLDALSTRRGKLSTKIKDMTSKMAATKTSRRPPGKKGKGSNDTAVSILNEFHTISDTEALEDLRDEFENLLNDLADDVRSNEISVQGYKAKFITELTEFESFDYAVDKLKKIDGDLVEELEDQIKALGGEVGGPAATGTPGASGTGGGATAEQKDKLVSLLKYIFKMEDNVFDAYEDAINSAGPTFKQFGMTLNNKQLSQVKKEFADSHNSGDFEDSVPSPLLFKFDPALQKLVESRSVSGLTSSMVDSFVAHTADIEKQLNGNITNLQEMTTLPWVKDLRLALENIESSWLQSKQLLKRHTVKKKNEAVIKVVGNLLRDLRTHNKDARDLLT